MIVRTKTPQHDLFGILDLLGIAVAPLERDLGVGVGVDEDVEGAVAVEHGEEGDGAGDLAEEGLDLLVDVVVRLAGVLRRVLLLLLWGFGFLRAGGRAVLLVCGAGGGGGGG